MLNKHKLHAVAAAIAVVACTFGAAAQAQEAQRVEITGSSIKRIASEGALPVQVITAEQINRSGATSVAELVQKLPAMQGFTIADIAIGTNSGGIVTASLHDIGESYTLVLLNGRRVAPTGSGTRINLNAIPMAAIDRIEVLTDGASALYGSDAIAGVVNFILKSSMQGGTVTARTDVPLEGGGKSANASITYGFGDLDKDRFSLVASYRRDEQKQLKSVDRDFAKSAYLPFEFNGTKYIYDRTSTSAIPANATVTFKRLTGETSTLPSYAFNPYQKKNGQCAADNFYSLNNATSATSVTEMCAFDFVSTIDVVPESTRDSLFLSGKFKVNDKFNLFSDLAYSRLDLTARIAPNPVPVSISTSSSYYQTYVLPYLTAAQAAHVNTVTANYRASDFGTRDSQTITDSKHFVFGVDGEVGGWSINSAVTWSQNKIDERYVGGYFKDTEFRSMVSKLQFDPFLEAGKQSAAASQLIANSIFNGTVRDESTTLKGIDFRASGEVAKLPAGPLQLGFGADYRTMNFKRDPSAAALNGEIYNYAPVAHYDMDRSLGGAFAELLVPVIKNLDLTASLRYDRVSAIKSDGVTVGESSNATTYKLAGRYQVMPSLLLRASYGTGFKVADMLDIANPLTPNGVTAASYDCPFPGTDYCKPGKQQYSSMLGGNAAIKPEKSKQATIGVRFEPSGDFNIGADYWEVKIRDAVSGVSANQAFADPQKYKDLFILYKTPAEPQQYWTFINASTNIGQAINKGIDWDMTGRVKTGIGRLTLGLSGTYLIESKYTRAGTKDDFTDSMNHYGENANVSFRNIWRGTASLDTGPFTNTLSVKWRNGYTDQNQLVRNVATNKNERVSLEIGDYMTIDWQGVYSFNKALEFRLGVKNLMNKKPPLTLRDSSGHQVGYDPRYADPFLRTVYVTASYNF
ncbi:TonB-dependent receptor [Aquabacterium sp.]|uniref:TonB-dependent receptor n=1 Tax=Aquabacterium sp. TaxID=1872578 RepID=UPI0037842D4A